MCGWTFAYNINPGIIASVTDGVTGSVVHETNFAKLSTGAAADGHAQIVTLKSARYIPGIGGMARFTAKFATPVADSIQWIGMMNTEDGWAFGYNGTVFGILRRAAGVDVWYPQSEWNGDKTGWLDTTKGNVYQIEYQWLGYGAQTFFIENFDGELIHVHTIKYAGQNVDTSVDNPNLPLAARVENLGNTSDLVLYTPSAIAGLDGDPFNEALALPVAPTVSKSIGTGADIPLMAVFNPLTWEGKNNHLFAQAMWINFATEGVKPVLFKIIAGATIVGGAFSEILPGLSPLQVNTTFTSFTGGVQIGAFPLARADTFLFDLTGIRFRSFAGNTFAFVADTTANSEVLASLGARQFI